MTIPFKEAIVGDLRPCWPCLSPLPSSFRRRLLQCRELAADSGTAREPEITLRAALGATRWRLLRQLMTESTSLAVVGGLLGIVVAYYLQRVLIVTAPAGLPRLEQIGFDARAISFAVGGSVVGAALARLAPRFGLYGAARLAAALSFGDRHDRNANESAGTRWIAAGGGAPGHGVGGTPGEELSAVAAGRSRILAARLTVLHVPLVGVEYRNPERRLQFFEELVSRLQSLPGIAGVTPVLLRPFTGNDGWTRQSPRTDSHRRRPPPIPAFNSRQCCRITSPPWGFLSDGAGPLPTRTEEGVNQLSS